MPLWHGSPLAPHYGLMGTTRRRAKSARKPTATEATAAADSLFGSAPAQKEVKRPSAGGRQLPLLSKRYLKMVESTFDLPEPDALFERLYDELDIDDALTPGALQAALNKAEKNALLAHKLYVNAKADHAVFEIEMDGVMASMRDVVTAELQAEKDAKTRSKQITEGDIKEYIAWRYADEWGEANTRKVKAEGMLKHVARLSDLWTQRCRSLASMLHARNPT